MNLWERTGQQLQHPQGLSGRAIGHAMRWVNARPNRLAIARLDVAPTDTVLELGFGPGHAIAQLARRASHGKIYGIDASPAMLRQASQRNRHAIAAGRVMLQQGSWSPIALLDNSLDKILAVNVVYFWQDPASMFAECYRLLRPGGKLALYATDAKTMQHWKFATEDTHRHCTAESLRTAMLQGGFDAAHLTIEPCELGLNIRGILATASKPLTSIH